MNRLLLKIFLKQQTVSELIHQSNQQNKKLFSIARKYFTLRKRVILKFSTVKGFLHWKHFKYIKIKIFKNHLFTNYLTFINFNFAVSFIIIKKKKQSGAQCLTFPNHILLFLLIDNQSLKFKIFINYYTCNIIFHN